MTGRRKAERRRGQFVQVITERRSGEDRREFLRRMAELVAQFEALKAGRDRDNVLVTLVQRLRDRGVEV